MSQEITAHPVKRYQAPSGRFLPYRGIAPALTDLIAGHGQIGFPGTIASIEHIRTGALRALAVTTATRMEALPDLPTVGEFLAGYEASAWAGLGAPKGTPTGIIEKLNRGVNAGLANPRIRARFADLGGTPLPGIPADFGKLIADETEKWAKVIRAANIKPE
jgi:tripartite-type tricarboxylate transporter receptor subunit TctC